MTAHQKPRSSINALFPTLVYEATLQRSGTAAFNRQLLREIERLCAEDLAGRRWSAKNYPAGYTSYASLSALQTISPTFAALEHKLTRHVNKFAGALAFYLTGRKLAMTGQGRASDPVAVLGNLIPNPARAAELAALFPHALGEDGLPVGWISEPLDQIADFLNGLALQKFPAKDGEPCLPVIKIADLRNGVTAKSDRASRHLPSKYIINDGDYIFSWSGSLMAKVWSEGEGALNQHLFKVTSERFPQWFYASWVQHHLAEFQMIAASKATTMGHIQRGHLKAAMTVCPDIGCLAAMDQLMRPLWEKMLSNDLENRILAETRDYLLPRLMSGKVRVADAARIAA